MNRQVYDWMGIGTAMILVTTAFCSQQRHRAEPAAPSTASISLPAPARDGRVSLEEALAARRSVRSSGRAPLSLAEVSQLLWAAQGKTDNRGFRTAPSAGALYPLELYLAAARVTGLKPGIYRYRPETHALDRVGEGDRSADLRRAALNQRSLGEAAAVVVMAAVYGRVTGKYGDRGVRYTQMEAGHAAQNLLLQAQALGLGAVPIGAFNDESIKEIVGGNADERPVYLIPVGRP